MFKGMVQNDNLQILQNKLSRSTICKNLIGNDNLLKMIQNTVCKFCRECSRTTICKLQMMIIILSNSDHHIILILPLPYHQQQQGRTLSAILPRYRHQWPFDIVWLLMLNFQVWLKWQGSRYKLKCVSESI